MGVSDESHAVSHARSQHHQHKGIENRNYYRAPLGEHPAATVLDCLDTFHLAHYRVSAKFPFPCFGKVQHDGETIGWIIGTIVMRDDIIAEDHFEWAGLSRDLNIVVCQLA